MDKSEEPDILKKARDFLDVFKKGEEFTHDLLKENERLRYRLVLLEEEKKASLKSGGTGSPRALEELEALREENRALKERYREIEAENRDFAARYVEVEEENNALANLYVASYQLHSTLDFKEVVRIIIEIVINLVGAEQFALFILDEVAGMLEVVASEGIDARRFRKVKTGEGTIGSVAYNGESYFSRNLNTPVDAINPQPIICIPLKIQDRIIGALAVFSLFEQKKKNLARVDYELFSMLAGHAATALFSSKLYSESERKLSTMRGFLDLLSGKGKQGD